jgi:hypothetical protein
MTPGFSTLRPTRQDIKQELAVYAHNRIPVHVEFKALFRGRVQRPVLYRFAMWILERFCAVEVMNITPSGEE